MKFINLIKSSIRATHDSEYRKLKNETKKLLEVVGNVKKSAAHTSHKQLSDVAKLTEEVTTLKDGKNLLEKRMRSCTCAKVAKSSSTVDQLTATAKAEIQKLVRFKRRLIKKPKLIEFNLSAR